MTNGDKIRVTLKDGVAVFSFDNPPVNQISPDFLQEIIETVTAGFGDDAIKAMVLTGTDKNFIAGADITQLHMEKDRNKIFQSANPYAEFLNRIEAGPKPVVAAINGNCLGAGLEMAMACHYRIAVNNVKLGQPEIQLGLIPGAGGTQRLPRLIGLPKAFEMITVGNAIKAEKAFSMGMVDEMADPDEIVETALKAAGKFISRELNLELRRTRNLHYRLPSATEKKNFLGLSKKLTAQKAKGYKAPFKAIEALEEGLGFDIEADIRREVDLFCDCAVSDESKNLIGIFFNSRSAGRLPRIEGVRPGTIKKVAVLGSGVMGSGIVHLLLKGGFDTVLWDINDGAMDNGLNAIRKTFAYAIEKKKMRQADLDRMMHDKLTGTTSLEDIKDVDLVIETVVEDMKIKQDIWRRVEGICRPDTIFGTNTSALPITEMASVLKTPDRMIGLHFFNPAERMKLLEIICAEQTSDHTLATGVAFARITKKIPIVVNDGLGFYVSRQIAALFGGAIFLMGDGVDSAVIEDAILDFGMPMGPAKIADLTGIDINYHVSKSFEERMGERYRVHPLLELIYKTGCYGRKTGSGYLEYSVNPPVPNQKVVAVVEQYLKINRITPKKMDKQEIIETMLALAINEAALIMEEGVCDRPQDMDLAMIQGTGFPPYRGGILRYADKWGIRNVYERLLTLEKSYGPRFKTADKLKEMAESGKKFYSDSVAGVSHP